ncbi:MAG: PKD domain-containing protein [Acidobacteriota bacterium]|nr:PKD domain-containing protein [Acidobacteriota bacterium]
MHRMRAFFPRLSQVSAVLLTLLLLGCASTSENPTPDTVTLTISVAPTSINNLGATATVTARAVHSTGNVVVNDTRIVLSITQGDGTLRTGSAQGRSVETFTVNGQVSATFVSGEEIGTVTITAQSGSLGTDGSIAATVDVVDTYGTPTLILNPNNLLRVGGESVLSLLVVDASGEPLADEAVVFSTDRGSLESNGSTVRTNQAGVATDTLRLPQPNDAVTEVNITASVGNKVVQGAISVSENQNPVPLIIASPSAITIDNDVFFDGTTSTDSDGAVVSYRWWFGDGSVASGPQVSHRYDEDGQYTVLMMVTDDAGASAGTTTTIDVGDNVGPTATFVVTPSAPRVNMPVFFDARESVDTDGEIVRYDWNFGDGTLLENQIVPTAEHTYLGAETYTVLLTATDNDGATGIAKVDVTVVGNELPTAALSASPNPASVGEPIGFDATASTDADGEIIAYRYDFGDGTITVGGPLIRHSYNRPGTYEVFLTVTDNEGGEGSVVLEITVNENEAPTASFTTSNSKPAIDERVTFDGSSSTDTDGEILFWDWFFGDGSSTRGTGPLAVNTYRQDGSYLVLLTVTDEMGGQGFVSSIIEVQANSAPTAAFAISNSTPERNEEIAFDAGGSSDSDGDIVEYRWGFGDSTILQTSSEPLIRHTYTAIGVYEVFLRVTDDLGAFGFATDVVTVGNVENVAPTASLTILPSSPTTSNPVGFDASGSSDSDGTIISYTFEFGDGASIPRNPNPLVFHTYDTEGTYVVFLTVEDDMRARGFASDSIDVEAGTNVAPVAVISVSPSSGWVTASNIVFDGTGSTDANGDDTIISFTWTFGDGNSGSGSQVSHSYSSAGTYIVTLLVGDTGDLYNAASTTLAVSAADPKPKARLRILPGIEEGTLVLDASGSEDPDDALEQLKFSMAGHAPPGVSLDVPAGGAPMRLVKVTDSDEPTPLTFALAVTDPSGGVDHVVKTITWPLDPRDIGPDAHLSVEPVTLPPAGGTVNLIGGLTHDHGWGEQQLETHFWHETAGKARVQIVGTGLDRRALISGGAPGDVINFRMRASNPRGRSDVVTRTITLGEPGSSAPRVHAEITGMRYDGDKLLVDLDARTTTDPDQALPDKAFTWRALAARPGTKAIIWTKPQQPGLATATIQGARPGDWLSIVVRATDDSGLKGRRLLRFRAPGR